MCAERAEGGHQLARRQAGAIIEGRLKVPALAVAEFHLLVAAPVTVSEARPLESFPLHRPPPS
jgi:hypothetical protein